MAKYFIKSISIEGFRGINNIGCPLLINLQTDGVTSIFGENGKGKSSIFEAFIFSILGRIVRFDEFPIDIKDKKSIKNLFHPGDGCITIEFIDDSHSISKIDVKVNTNGDRTISSISTPDPEAFLKSLCSNLNFLDHKSFEKIMMSSSEDTGKLFANIVGFGKFIDIKEKLDKISRTQNVNNDFGRTVKETAIRNNKERINELKEEIKKKLEEIGFPLVGSFNRDEILTKIKTFINYQYMEKIKSISTHTLIDFDLLIKNKIGLTYEEDALKLSSQKENVETLKSLNRSIKKFSNKLVGIISRKLQSAYTYIDTPDDIVLGKLFDDAIISYDLISEFDKNTCILCNTENLGNTKKTFYTKINDKIDQYRKFKASYNSFFSYFIRQIKSCKIIDYEQIKLKHDSGFFSSIEKDNDYLKSDFFITNNLLDILQEYCDSIKNEIVEINASIKELTAKVPPKISKLVEVNNAFKHVFRALIEIEDLSNQNEYNSKYLHELENWTSYINSIKEDYEESYNNLMEEIASIIDEDTKKFFREIMGNVEITPKIKKDTRGQKVNILLEKFYSNTSDLKAAPLLSESYKNALCISIYLAAVLKSKNRGNFIIVDDITSSFDSGHQFYLLDLIKTKISISSTNKKGKQVIFLSHDGLIKKVLNQNNSLHNWTHYNLNFNKDITSLKSFNSTEQRQVIENNIASGNYMGSDFRLYYESILLEIIEKLDLEVPFSLINNNDNKMVSKLINAIHEIIELKRKSGKITRVARRLPNECDFKSHTQQLVNNLSHYATGSGASLATPVLIRILDDIDTFKQFFQYNCTCPEKHLGWSYYNTLTSPLHKGCKCTL